MEANMNASAADAMNADYSAHRGPLAPFMADPNVTEVMVVGGRDVYVEVQGRLVLTPVTFGSEQEVLELIRFIVESVGRRIDTESPICDARLPDGSRVHAAIQPVPMQGPL